MVEVGFGDESLLGDDHSVFSDGVLSYRSSSACVEGEGLA